MKTHCLVVDDEPLAIEVIASHIGKMESLELTASCRNAVEAFEILKSKKIDLLFLDIQMPGMKGTDFLKTLRNPPKVIFTTAYREYAIESYELDVVDYLLKPISFERFFKAVTKYFQANPGEILVYKDRNGNINSSYVYVRANKKVHKVMLSDILFIESIKDYLTIHTKARNITARHTITSFEERLPETDFIRIHRSFVVSMNQITGFTANTIEIGDKELPIGRNYRQSVFKALNFQMPSEE